MTFRLATLDDCRLLAELNHQLIQDEGHRNRMTVPALELEILPDRPSDAASSNG